MTIIDDSTTVCLVENVRPRYSALGVVYGSLLTLIVLFAVSAQLEAIANLWVIAGILEATATCLIGVMFIWYIWIGHKTVLEVEYRVRDAALEVSAYLGTYRLRVPLRNIIWCFHGRRNRPSYAYWIPRHGLIAIFARTDKAWLSRKTALGYIGWSREMFDAWQELFQSSIPENFGD